MTEELNATQGALDLAEEAELDLSGVSIAGSGDEGKIYKKDVEEYLAQDVGPAPYEEESEPGSDVHTVVRGISKTNKSIASPDGGIFPATFVDAYISSWLNKGYELKDTFYLGETPQAFRMMYVLVRE